jgi:hypothetical protein
MKSAVIRLTPKQLQGLRELFAECQEAHGRSVINDYKPDERMSILGQVRDEGDPNNPVLSGHAKFWLLSREQYEIVNRAITRARKIK